MVAVPVLRARGRSSSLLSSGADVTVACVRTFKVFFKLSTESESSTDSKATVYCSEAIHFGSAVNNLHKCIIRMRTGTHAQTDKRTRERCARASRHTAYLGTSMHALGVLRVEVRCVINQSYCVLTVGSSA